MASGMNSQENALVGRVALVTGGSRGIGFGIAKALAQAGADVGIMAQDPSMLQKALEAIQIASSKKTLAIAGDVTDSEDVLRCVEAMETEIGPTSILVNSAGQSLSVGPVWNTDPAVWWRDVEVNLRGTFLVSRAVVGRMIELSMPGCVINLASAAGNVPLPMASAYACSKAAIQRFTDSAALSLSPHQISMFALSPGMVHTEMTERLVSSPEVHRWMPEWREAPPDKWTPIERVCKTAVLLASGRANALSGRFIHATLNVQHLIEEAEEIRAKDLYTLRLREPERSR